MWHDAARATAHVRAAESAVISVRHDFALPDADIGIERAELCRNCGCDAARRRFKRRDLCGKCFYLLEYIRSVERWDRARPETLKNAGTLRRRYGADALPALDTMSDEGFAALKASILDQLMAALRALRAREARRRGDVRVDGGTIEQKLKNILRVVQLRDKYDRVAGRFNGVSTVLNQSFSPEQCRILYGLLDDIEEQTYGQVTESHKAFEAVYQQRHAETPTMVPQAPQAAPLATASAPGDLWLVDFRHRVRSGETALLVVDAHTQAVVASGACSGNGFDVLQERLAGIFRAIGMPACVLVRHAQPRTQLSALDVWLIEHDVAASPPARQPKAALAGLDAIVNRLRGDMLGRMFATAQAADEAIAAWGRAASGGPGASLRVPSRGYLEEIVPFAYEPHDIIRRVQERGRVSLFGRIVRVPKALRGKDIAFRPTERDGVFDVLFRSQRISAVRVGPAATPQDSLPGPRLAPDDALPDRLMWTP